MTEPLKGLAPVKRAASLAESARGELRAAVMAGRFEPGARLTVRSVAQALGVSFTPAREALYGLVSEGALETAASGTAVVPVLDEARVHELLVIRQALECVAAREAVAHVDAAALTDLRACHAALIEADRCGDYKRLMALNWQFHFAIYGASEMPRLVRIIEGCWLQTGSYLNVIYPDYGRTDGGIRNHEAILAALEAGDSDRLAEAIGRDIEMSGEALVKAIRAG